MANCFVIQPFDAGKFDKRYEQVFKPAIVAADLELFSISYRAAKGSLNHAVASLGVMDGSIWATA